MSTQDAGRFPWVLALLLCSCSRETTEVSNGAEQAEVDGVSLQWPPGTKPLEKLTSQELWVLGVQRFGWYAPSPPEGITRESMIEQFSVGERSTEEIWAEGVERFGWQPEEPPERSTREEIMKSFSGDSGFPVLLEIDYLEADRGE